VSAKAVGEASRFASLKTSNVVAARRHSCRRIGMEHETVNRHSSRNGRSGVGVSFDMVEHGRGVNGKVRRFRHVPCRNSISVAGIGRTGIGGPAFRRTVTNEPGSYLGCSPLKKQSGTLRLPFPGCYLSFNRKQASFVLKREGMIDRLSYCGYLPNNEGSI
jgi:hypothetical protein